MSHTISLWYKTLPFLAATLVLFGVSGCSDDESLPNDVPPQNHAPVISFTVPLAAPASTLTTTRKVTLTVGVTDAESDPVTVQWRIVRDGQPSGVLNAAQQGLPSIEWQTPVALGRDSIYVTASDGKASTVVKETIQVGTLKTDRIAGVAQTWSAAESPFIISPAGADFVIDEMGHLTVEAGSELYLDKRGMGISVVGTLDTDGTAGSPVVIRPNWRAAKAGDWKGITATPSGDPPVVNLAYTQLMYAVVAVQGNTTAAIHLDGCRISHSRDVAVQHESSRELRVENSVIVDNLNSGIKIRKFAKPLPMNIQILDNIITSNGDVTGATPYTDEAGVYIAIPDTDAQSTIAITGNQIFNNGVPGIHLVNACYPIVNGNAIYSNELGKLSTRYNIKLEQGFGVGGAGDAIDATMNYWGGYYDPARGESLIKDMVYDSEDHGSIAVRVVVTPWKNVWP